MNNIDPAYRTLGSGPTFSVWAPNAKTVELYFPEKKSRLKLKRLEFGYWATSQWIAREGELYWIEVDEKRLADPASLSQPHGVNGPSQVFKPSTFRWNDSQWKNHLLDEYIIYEIHTGTFTDTGTFSSITEKLSYLSDLGITAIEIMPVAQFPGERNWGYDVVFPFAVQNSYGGPRALQYLVDECHRAGIAVVLDVVINHLGPEGNNMQTFGPYFTDKYKTPWGSAINFDDAGSDAVRKYYIENVLMWFRDFHIDAVRLDAVHAIRDFGPVHILSEIRRYSDQLSAITGRTYYLIAECDLNDVRYIKTRQLSGYGMNAQWMDEFHHALRVSTGEKRKGYYSDFNGIEHLAKSFRTAYVYDGIYSAHRDRTFGTSAKEMPGSSFVVFSQNHDQVGNRMLGERTSTLVPFEVLKLMATAVLISPYLPLLFMGEEYGEPNPFLYFVSHEGKDLIEAVRQGRRKEFEHFFSGENFPDPQSAETFGRSKLSWKMMNTMSQRILHAFYRKLIHTRKSVSALRTLNRSALTVNVAGNCIRITRQHSDEDVLCILNFSDEPQKILLPPGYLPLLYSGEKQWGGDAESINPGDTEVVIKGYSGFIATYGHV
ncbi:MAG: malto-oligosyltrehalose trehalohydrolase [Bacteroidota bacterium]